MLMSFGFLPRNDGGLVISATGFDVADMGFNISVLKFKTSDKFNGQDGEKAERTELTLLVWWVN